MTDIVSYFNFSICRIPLSSFQVVGGIILGLFALTMIFRDGKPREEIGMRDAKSDAAIFSLTIPFSFGFRYACVHIYLHTVQQR